MKRFKVTAIRTDEYIIELDETKFNDEWKEGFESVFHNINGLEDVARDLAYQQLRLGSEGSGRFVEGYGPVLRNGRMPFSRNDFDEKGNWLPEDKRDKPAEGINIIINREDDDYDFEIEELTEGSTDQEVAAV